MNRGFHAAWLVWSRSVASLLGQARASVALPLYAAHVGDGQRSVVACVSGHRSRSVLSLGVLMTSRLGVTSWRRRLPVAQWLTLLSGWSCLSSVDRQRFGVSCSFLVSAPAGHPPFLTEVGMTTMYVVLHVNELRGCSGYLVMVVEMHVVEQLAFEGPREFLIRGVALLSLQSEFL